MTKVKYWGELILKQGSLSTIDKFKKTFIGDRKFYSTVLALMLPIIIQNTISNFINLLDNIMIGQVGTAEMSGVAISNQLLFVFNITLFGGLAGAGVFCAQFFGAGNHKDLRHTVRFKLWSAVVIFAIGIFVFLTFGEQLISLYLTGDGDAAQRAAMLKFGKSYLRIMLWGLFPFALSLVYSGTLREVGESLLPMKASLAGMLTNLCLNYILIYGKLGFPALGVEGAAIATVISRFVELAIIVVFTHRHHERFSFVKGLYKSLKIPNELILKIIKKGIPLLVIELLWSFGMTTLNQIFSTRGLNVVAALNINSTITNLFNVVVFSMGAAVSVMVGQALGANDFSRAKQTAWRLMFFNVCICIVTSILLAALSPVIPYVYKTTSDVRMLATRFIQAHSIFLIFNAIIHCSYFTIRSGGKMLIIFLFDSVYTWLVSIPFAFILTHFTTLDISILYPICFLADIIKCIIGIIFVKSGRWVQNIVSNTASNVEPSTQ